VVVRGEVGVGEDEDICWRGEEPRGDEGVSKEDLAVSAKTEADTKVGEGMEGESVAGLVLWKQFAHTLTGLSLMRGSRSLLLLQFPQQTTPHLRQWCLRLKVVNFASTHTMQISTEVSGIHTAAAAAAAAASSWTCLGFSSASFPNFANS